SSCITPMIRSRRGCSGSANSRPPIRTRSPSSSRPTGRPPVRHPYRRPSTPRRPASERSARRSSSRDSARGRASGRPGTPCMRALYRGSQAGVDVQLDVRGMCSLRARVPGVSDNIEVVSVVGRFLEHSRIYSFERAGETERVFTGSADLMPRNLYNRVELVSPIEDPRIRGQLLDILDRCLADNTNAWVLNADGSWRRRRPAGEPRNVQRELMEMHEARAAGDTR